MGYIGIWTIFKTSFLLCCTFFYAISQSELHLSWGFTDRLLKLGLIIIFRTGKTRSFLIYAYGDVRAKNARGVWLMCGGAVGALVLIRCNGDILEWDRSKLLLIEEHGMWFLLQIHSFIFPHALSSPATLAGALHRLARRPSSSGSVLAGWTLTRCVPHVTAPPWFPFRSFPPGHLCWEHFLNIYLTYDPSPSPIPALIFYTPFF